MKNVLIPAFAAFIACCSVAWAQPPAPVEVQYEAPPPPPQVEVIPVAPSPNHLWIGGYWGWQGGRHFWHAGRYEMRRPGMNWQAASWARHGRGWRYAPGYWRR